MKRTLKIHAIPGETLRQTVARVLKEVSDAFEVDIEFELELNKDGHGRITADFDVLMVYQTDETVWDKIKANLRAIAERALRGDGA